MSIFKKAVLTKAGKALIIKSQANHGSTEFTKAVSGAGSWSLTEDIESATELKEEKQTFGFSGIDIPEGNPSTVVVTVLLNNKDLKELYYVTELGIYANDPDDGEVLYALIVADEQTIYLPAENGTGVSSITERINIEVSNSSAVVVRTDAGLVSASDFLSLKKLVAKIDTAFKEGEPGQTPFKKSSESYDVEWKDPKKDTIVAKKENFPEIGQADTIYVDQDDASIYIWKDEEYFKLPLGADAAETLQEQITKNAESIKGLTTRTETLEKRFTEQHIRVLADDWTETNETGISVYTQEVEASTSADTEGTVWPDITATEPALVVDEQKAQAVFFAYGRAFTEDGRIVLKCYKKKPGNDFGLLIQGGA